MTDPGVKEGRQPRADLVRTARVGAALLVLYIVSHLLLLWRFPWFVDETIFAWFAQTAQGDPAQRFIALSDHKGLINTWIGAALIHLGIAPMTAMRVISVVAGIVASAATGYLVWRWYRAMMLTLIAAALVAFVPYMFVHDALGVYDAFIAAGSMVALALQLDLARRVRLDLALLLGATWGVLLLAKPTGALAIVLVPFSLMLFDWQSERRVRRLLEWAGLVALALVIAGCMYALTRASAYTYAPAPQYHRSLHDLFTDPFGNWGTVAPAAWDAMWGYLTPPGVVLAVWGAVSVMLRRDRFGLVVVVWSLAAIAAFLLLTDSAYPRYGLQAVPPICILIVMGGDDLWTRATARVSWRWLALAAVLLAIPALLLDGRVLATPKTAPYPGLDRDQYVTLVSNREPVHEAADLIVKRAPVFTASTPESQRTVVDLNGSPWSALLALNGKRYTATPRFVYMDHTSDHAKVNAARWLIVEGDPPDWLKLSGAHRLKRWERPGGGPSVVLYERGARSR
jgi:hypothetical protein